jgi:uncharacterized membrane protein YvlD (DUF360 family)
LRFIYRYIANGLAFYLGLYLVDSLLAPRFYIEKGWIAIVLAALLGPVNSVVRPFRHFKTKRNRALGWFGLTALGNYLFMQIIILVGAPLSGNPFCVALAAVFLTGLAVLLNSIVGFRPEDKPAVLTREHGLRRTTRTRERRPRERQPRV